jgi:hypothetical protein
MYQRQWALNLNMRQRAEPGDSLFSQHGTGPGGCLANRCPKGRWCRRLTCKLLQRYGSKQHFIRVARHAAPSQVAYAIDNVRRARACIREITAVENQVGRGLFQILQDRFESRSIPMNVG